MTVPRCEPLLIYRLAQIIVNFFQRYVLLAVSQHHHDLNRAASDDQSPGSKSPSASDEVVKHLPSERASKFDVLFILLSEARNIQYSPVQEDLPFGQSTQHPHSQELGRLKR